MVWRDDSVGKAFVLQSREPEFSSLNAGKAGHGSMWL